MKLEFESLVEFHAMAEAMGYVKGKMVNSPLDVPKEAPKKEAPKKEAPKKEDPKKEDPKKEDPKKEETSEVTIDDVVALATEMIGDTEKPERRNAVVEMVQAMGVSRVTLIPADKVAEAMAMIEGK